MALMHVMHPPDRAGKDFFGKDRDALERAGLGRPGPGLAKF